MARRGPRRSGSAAARKNPTGTSASPQARGVVVERSRPLLERLARLPPVIVPAGMLVLMLLGLTAPLPFALPALAIAAAFVAWLAYLSWPALSSRGRLLRGVMIGLVVGAAVGRVAGWL
jgi:Family of unknown function (DUF6703)